MEERTLKMAMEIFGTLVSGEEISRTKPSTAEAYQAYYGNSEVYDLVTKLLGRLNLSLYEYNETLFVTAGDGNKIFGYTNDDLKRLLGLRLNRELFLVYFIIYQTLLIFYSDSATFQIREYVRLEELLQNVTNAAESIMRGSEVFDALEEKEKEGFRSVAQLWHELPLSVSDDADRNKAGRTSRLGMVKLTMNFLQGEKLFLASEDRFYPTDRFRALAEGYFEDEKGRLTKLFGGQENA